MGENEMDFARRRGAWEAFMAGDAVDQTQVRPEVLASWRRCRAAGLVPDTEYLSCDLDEAACRLRLADGAGLVLAARPCLEAMQVLTGELEIVTFLTDADAFVLDACGKGLSWEYCKARHAVVGASLAEHLAGTTSVVLALEHDRPFQMLPGEQYLEANHVASCVAAPIHDAAGLVAGCLTITAEGQVAAAHSQLLGMVTTVAEMIELRLKNGGEQGFSRQTAEYLRGAMETMGSGLIIMNREHLITHANPAAGQVLGRDIKSGTPVDELIRNRVILDALKKQRDLNDREIIFQEVARSPRCLVDVKPVHGPDGERIGSVLRLQELKSIQKLVQQVAGSPARYTFDDIRGQSAAMARVIRTARAVAGSPAGVLIMGESGTGKEMVAQAVHNAGPRARMPFFAINCAAIPHDLIESELFGYEAGTFTGAERGGRAGKLELAEGGTFFFDEVNAMSLHMQAKLLRVLEEKRFLRLGGTQYCPLNVRFIAAANCDLLAEVERGNFRSDLYYRLNVLQVVIPPLRERVEDVALLTGIFMEDVGRETGKRINGISEEALARLEAHSWPGNVRELKNCVERAVNLCEGPLLDVADFVLPQPGSSAAAGGPVPVVPAGTLAQQERAAIEDALLTCRGNVSRAARQLDVGRNTLYRKMRRYGLGPGVS